MSEAEGGADMDVDSDSDEEDNEKLKTKMTMRVLRQPRRHLFLFSKLKTLKRQITCPLFILIRSNSSAVNVLVFIFFRGHF